MPFVLQRNGRTSLRELYRNAEGQLCVWHNEHLAEQHAEKVQNNRQKWRVRTAGAMDYHPLKKRWPSYKPTYKLMDVEQQEVKTKTTSPGCLVELFEDYTNRRVAIASKAPSEVEFISEVATAMADDFRGDWSIRLRELLPLIVDMCCKYRGYKAETVQERREFVAGDLEMPKQ